MTIVAVTRLGRDFTDMVRTRRSDAPTDSDLMPASKFCRFRRRARRSTTILIVPGFGLRVTPAGARAFILNYRTRAGGRERRYTIGDLKTWATTAARETCDENSSARCAGNDPLGELVPERAAPTVNDVDRSLRHRALPRKRPRSRIEDERLLPIIRDALGRAKVAHIYHAHVDRLHQAVTHKRGPFRANRVLALLSKMFSLSIKWRMLQTIPGVGHERNPEPKRARFLSAAEVGRLLDVLEHDQDQQAADIIRLLLLTGARSAEVLAPSGHISTSVPAFGSSRTPLTKQKEEHRLPLADEAVALLWSIRATAPAKARFVFSGASPFQHRRSIRHAWDRIAAAAEIADVRIHDLRHSHASFLVNAGYSLPVIGALLGHKTPQTTARYAHLADDTLSAAAGSVGRVLAYKRRGK